MLRQILRALLLIVPGALCGGFFAVAALTVPAPPRPREQPALRVGLVPLGGARFHHGHLVAPPPLPANPPRPVRRHRVRRAAVEAPPPPPEAADAFRAALRTARGTFERCYDDVLRSRPDLAGTFTVSVHVAADGRITLARIVDTRADAVSVAACVTRRIRQLRLPEVREEVELVLPVHLEAHNRRG